MNQLNPAEFVNVEGAIRAATDAILSEQRPDGHWVYELEADATIPAEYVLLVHYLAETPNLELEKKIGVYLRRIQGAHGGWPLYHDGAFDISATVKASFALTMSGDDMHAPHMGRAGGALRARGPRLELPGNDVFLGAEERGVDVGQTLELTTSGGPGETAALVLTSVNGAPLFLVIEVGPLDSAGQRIFEAVIPPPAAGLVLGFRAFATIPTGIADSAQETIEIE